MKSTVVRVASIFFALRVCFFVHFLTMPTKKKQAGVGATGSCFQKYVHPSEFMRQLFPHDPKARLEGFIITGEDVRVVRRKSPAARVYLFRHDSVPNQELYANKRNVKITVEGHPDHFFGAVVAPPANAAEIEAQEQETIQNRIDGTAPEEINVPDAWSTSRW